MKKLSTLFLGIAFTAGFAQTNSFSQSIETIQISENSVLEDCSISVAESNLWGGAVNGAAYAVPFTIEQGTQFTPANIDFLVAVYNDDTYLIDDKEFVFDIYTDDGFFPGESIATTTATPTDATFVQELSFTSGAIAYAYRANIDISGLGAIEGSASGETMYWLVVTMLGADDIDQIGLNFTQGATGSNTYYDDGSGWNIFNASAPDNISFTYNMTGDCSVMNVSDLNSNSLAVYPNPVKDVINVTLKNADVKSIEITNMAGQKVFSGKASKSVNVSFLPAGVYTLKVVDTTGKAHINKIVKK